MQKLFWHMLRLRLAVIIQALLGDNITLAGESPLAEVRQTTAALEQIDRYTQDNQLSVQDDSIDAIAQVTSVSQLSDVQPTDWAFQALQSLVERYGCIAGYPDSTYRGNRALTRYEFAAGLNACLDRINELVATATSEQITFNRENAHAMLKAGAGMNREQSLEFKTSK